MATVSLESRPYEKVSDHDSSHESVNYLNHDHSILSWLLTLDHKRIGLLYLVTITLMFLLGGALAGAVRLELLTPKGDLLLIPTTKPSLPMVSSCCFSS